MQKLMPPHKKVSSFGRGLCRTLWAPPLFYVTFLRKRRFVWATANPALSRQCQGFGSFQLQAFVLWEKGGGGAAAVPISAIVWIQTIFSLATENRNKKVACLGCL